MSVQICQLDLWILGLQASVKAVHLTIGLLADTLRN